MRVCDTEEGMSGRNAKGWIRMNLQVINLLYTKYKGHRLDNVQFVFVFADKLNRTREKSK